MLINMKESKLLTKVLFLISIFFCLSNSVCSEIMILSGCKNTKDNFIKNEYILDLEKSLMTRNYIYDKKTFKKYRLNDLSVKKENFVERFIYLDENLILTDKVGYPQFYTQLVFKKNDLMINIKTVINGEVAISTISTCSKVELFEKES